MSVKMTRLRYLVLLLTEIFGVAIAQGQTRSQKIHVTSKVEKTEYCVPGTIESPSVTISVTARIRNLSSQQVRVVGLTHSAIRIAQTKLDLDRGVLEEGSLIGDTLGLDRTVTTGKPLASIMPAQQSPALLEDVVVPLQFDGSRGLKPGMHYIRLDFVLDLLFESSREEKRMQIPSNVMTIHIDESKTQGHCR